MALEDRTLKICNCNKTMALDAKALAGALKLKQPIEIHTELCRKQVASFQGALKDESCVVACTQEAPLFSELADQSGSTSELKFVNIREHAGWSKEGAKAAPKIAALLALADLPEPEPVTAVSYKAGGELLIVGPAEAAIPWAEKLAGQLEVNVLITSERGGELPAERRYEGYVLPDFAAGQRVLRRLAQDEVLPDVARLSDEGETHHAASLDASRVSSSRVTLTFGASPSSGTTSRAPVKSSSTV